MISHATCGLLATLLLATTDQAPPQADPMPQPIPFQRYTVKDSLGRTITFYLSVPPKNAADAKRPVVLFIAGSGCQSLFRKQGEQIAGGYQNLLLQEAR